MTAQFILTDVKFVSLYKHRRKSLWQHRFILLLKAWTLVCGGIVFPFWSHQSHDEVYNESTSFSHWCKVCVSVNTGESLYDSISVITNYCKLTHNTIVLQKNTSVRWHYNYIPEELLKVIKRSVRDYNKYWQELERFILQGRPGITKRTRKPSVAPGLGLGAPAKGSHWH